MKKNKTRKKTVTVLKKWRVTKWNFIKKLVVNDFKCDEILNANKTNCLMSDFFWFRRWSLFLFLHQTLVSWGHSRELASSLRSHCRLKWSIVAGERARLSQHSASVCMRAERTWVRKHQRELVWRTRRRVECIIGLKSTIVCLLTADHGVLSLSHTRDSFFSSFNLIYLKSCANAIVWLSRKIEKHEGIGREKEW